MESETLVKTAMMELMIILDVIPNVLVHDRDLNVGEDHQVLLIFV